MLDADDTFSGKFQVIFPKQEHVEYYVDHHMSNGFYILTNVDDAINFKLIQYELPTNTTTVFAFFSTPSLLWYRYYSRY